MRTIKMRRLVVMVLAAAVPVLRAWATWNESIMPNKADRDRHPIATGRLPVHLLQGFFCLVVVMVGMAASPASAGDTLRIMPLGDSITAGYTDNPDWNHPFEFGYRSGLYRRLKNAGMAFVFVGQSPEPWNNVFGDPTHGGTVAPELDLRDVGQDGHRGYGGASIARIRRDVAAWMAQDRPDVILLQIGINGISADSPEQLEALVKKIFETDNEVKLLVAQITPLATYNQQLVDYNRYIREDLVPAYDGKGHTIGTVDLYRHFLANPDDPKSINPAHLSNNINHPTNALYDKMAESWFHGIEMLLGK